MQACILWVTSRYLDILALVSTQDSVTVGCGVKKGDKRRNRILLFSPFGEGEFDSKVDIVFNLKFERRNSIENSYLKAYHFV